MSPPIDPKAVRTDDLPVESESSGNVNPADATLEGWPRSPAQRGLEPIVHPARVGPPRRSSGVAEQEDADLIVVGNKGMKGVRRVLGSIPNSVAHDAPLLRCSSSTRTKPAEPGAGVPTASPPSNVSVAALIEGK